MNKKPEKVKAAVLEEFGRIGVHEFDYPAINESSMIVKMIMAGVCGTDKHIFDGRAPETPLPIILGHENLGEVTEIGSKAATQLEVHGETLREGDKITWYPAIPCGKCWYCKWTPQNHVGFLCEGAPAYGLNMKCDEPPHLFGGWSEYVYIKPGTWVFKLPNELPDEVTVLVDIFAATGGVKKASMPYSVIKEGFGGGDTVIIQGSGPIGLAAGMTAKLLGASKIILIGGPSHRIKLVEQFDIFDEILNIEEYIEPETRIEAARNATPGKVGADLVVDCTGVPGAIPEGLEMVRRGGVFVEIGAFVNIGDTVINPFRHFVWRDITLLGQYGCPPQYYDTAIKFLLLAWERGWPLQKIVTHKFPIEKAQDAVEAHKRLECMKAVVYPKT